MRGDQIEHLTETWEMISMAVSQDTATWTCGPDPLPRFQLLCLRAIRGDPLGRLAAGSTHKTIYVPGI